MRKKLLFSLSNNHNRAVYIDGQNEYTYCELLEKVKTLNRFFMLHNIKRIAICMDKSFVSYSLIIAAYLSKVTFSVWNTELPKNRIEYFYSIYRPDVVFIANKEENILFENCVPIDSEFFDLNYAQGDELIEQAENELAYVLFTSGSTSLPKGCKISYRALDLLIEKAALEFGIKETDVCGQYAPFYFDMSILDIFLVPYVGATLVAFTTFSEKLRPGTLIQNKKISFINSVPQLYELLERGRQLKREVLVSVKKIKMGGDIVKKTLLDKIFEVLPKVEVYVTYGPTETTVICMIAKLNLENYQTLCDGYIAPLGKEIDGYSTITLTDDGEIVIGGPCVGLGYLSGENTGFITNGSGQPAYLSGDYAKVKDGQMFFDGRKDEQAKINGNRINVMEVDAALSKWSIESVTLVVSSRIILFYISEKYDEEAVRNMLENEIPNYELPSLIIRLTQFKYNSNGKVDRQFLRRCYKELKGE